MTRRTRLNHEFVEFVPSALDEGTLYVSMEYATATHLCCCGCGNKVVTPFSPTDWKLIFDGESISIAPSVGNWSFKCQSHYWIRNGRVDWAEKMSPELIQEVRDADKVAKNRYYGEPVEKPPASASPASPKPETPLAAFGRWLRGKLPF